MATMQWVTEATTKKLQQCSGQHPDTAPLRLQHLPSSCVVEGCVRCILGREKQYAGLALASGKRGACCDIAVIASLLCSSFLRAAFVIVHVVVIVIVGDLSH
mmetsp:Transcript_75668/g.179791  ORF Transcript_75668/g.179791 Transcript_75668/m.179791 type:complete len:102 (-) Transcript_75668:67-372(-)